MSPINPMLQADPQRMRLVKYFEAMAAEAEEGLLAARGVESTASASDLITMAAMRAAECFVFLRALLPDPGVLPADPGKVSKAVLLAPVEVTELAEHHDVVAAEAERQGQHDTAQRRRDRADQLRTLFSGAPL